MNSIFGQAPRIPGAQCLFGSAGASLVTKTLYDAACPCGQGCSPVHIVSNGEPCCRQDTFFTPAGTLYAISEHGDVNFCANCFVVYIDAGVQTLGESYCSKECSKASQPLVAYMLLSDGYEVQNTERFAQAPKLLKSALSWFWGRRGYEQHVDYMISMMETICDPTVSYAFAHFRPTVERTRGCCQQLLREYLSRPAMIQMVFSYHLSGIREPHDAMERFMENPLFDKNLIGVISRYMSL